MQGTHSLRRRAVQALATALNSANASLAGLANVACLLEAGIPEKEARWALTIVDSRAFTFRPDADEEQLVLVPLIDILNTTTLFKDGVQLWQCSFEPHGAVKEGALLLAEGPVKAGEELLHLYGPNSSATLWTVYGFLEDSQGHENLFEIAGLQVDVREVISSDPPELQSTKLAALCRAELPAWPQVRRLPAATVTVAGQRANPS